MARRRKSVEYLGNHGRNWDELGRRGMNWDEFPRGHRVSKRLRAGGTNFRADPECPNDSGRAGWHEARRVSKISEDMG